MSLAGSVSRPFRPLSMSLDNRINLRIPWAGLSTCLGNAPRAATAPRYASPVAYEQKTHPTDVDPRDYVDSLPAERRRREGHAMLDLFGDVTGEPAVMWGPMMIGYGTYSYTYETGHSGTYFRLGFSPRASAISLYGLQGFARSADLLEALGPHREGKSCVYVTSLARVDTDVLRELVAQAWAAEPGECGMC